MTSSSKQKCFTEHHGGGSEMLQSSQVAVVHAFNPSI